jgi:TRAP-type C4-dicarboxylate transport system substrate-binding protein
LTVFAHEFADALYEKSNGQIEITVYPYGTLGGTTDIIEACQYGEIEIVFSDIPWMAGFVPQAQVLSLEWLWPTEGYAEVMEDVCLNGEGYAMLKEKFRKKNFELLNMHVNGWFWWTSSKPLRTPADFANFKMRTQESKLIVEGFKAYGASPVPLAWGEVYSSLQLGVVDGCSASMIGQYGQKFYEVTDYWTKAGAAMYINSPCMNYQLYKSLPKDIQDMITETAIELIPPMAEWQAANAKEKQQEISELKPSLVFYEFTPAEQEPFKELYEPVREIFYEIGEEDAEAILAAFLNDIETAKAKLGVE